ncbi:MAG: magnesium transporter [Candidatus Eisenbacteria bacterium]|uniref:Magnesium transporter MgtE n=1 Tax=Eiseniibacteriota bacterium TaxID=2212470 RepID=A0A948RZY2_UNCEI|nr:magnesium transporter [Candidatus Eisenbacteria bacterium]MBU1949950.1 magnesium transporter [Candidatus Eisenbacteria bacterium]MBU2692758.1 magnesium transporter [Candidatus Eisenbacteria bacterium]
MQPTALLILPEVKSLLEKGDIAELRETLAHLHAADVAAIIVEIEDDDAKTLFLASIEDERVEIFEHLDETEQERLLHLVGAKAMIPIVEEMASDDRADLIQSLPTRLADALLKELPRPEQKDVEALVKYPEKTAGAIMTSEWASVPADATAAEALVHLRKVAPHRETIYFIYVTNPDRTLIGVLSLKDLVLADPESSVRSIMVPDVISMPVEADQEFVASKIAHYDFLAMPIVDSANRIVGIVTHDDAIDVIEEETTEDAQRMGAVTPLEDSYLETSFWQIIRKRGLWLAALFIGTMFTGTALKHYENAIALLPALVIFIPLIISTGGNTGSQSATLVIRALAVGDVHLRDWAHIMWRETRTGMALGLFLGLFGIARALLWGTGFPIAIVVGLTLLGIVFWGALAGSILPLGLRRVGLDPAIASAPFVASLVDVSGILLYFTIARFVLP